MEFCIAASPESFQDEEVFAFQTGDDSGFSSSPSTPATVDNSGTFADLFDLDPTFCDSLNASLFDGDLPVKLYTHIKIKEDENDDDDELWQPAAESLTCRFDNSSPSLDCFNEPVELIDELFGPSVNPRDIFKDTEKLCQKEKILAEVTNSVTCTNMSPEIAEDLSIQKEHRTHEIEQNICKRELRVRRKRAQIEHDYAKVEDQTGSSKDTDEEYEGNEEFKELSDDDEVYRATCPVKKALKTDSNSEKDAKYWERRKKNNLAAKRSREAKRAREIQTAKKTAALEKENANLKKQIRKLQADIKRAEKKVRMCTSILQQLKDLQTLKDDDVFTKNEFSLQKEKLLKEMSSL